MQRNTVMKLVKGIPCPNSIQKNVPRATEVLLRYEAWLNRHYGKTGTYLVNAKTFLKTYKPPTSVIYQLDDYIESRSLTIQSFLRRFRRFLEEKHILLLVNDLNEKKIPLGNAYVKLFLYHRQDRLRGDTSLSTYATVLNQYFNKISQDLSGFNKRSAEKFILAPALSDYTKRLYLSVLKNFCDWVLTYQQHAVKDLNQEQKAIQKALRLISPQTLREIMSIQVRSSKSQLKGYHKESLLSRERTKLLQRCRSQRDRAIVSLMAWNGLRTIEVTRLSVADIHFSKNTVSVWSKGKSAKAKDVIKLFSVPKAEVRKYKESIQLGKTGKLFPKLTRTGIDTLVNNYFEEMKLRKDGARYSAHSLRHTAGQLMYDKKIPLEFIQKTLRHAALETTLIYAQRAIDRNYFRKMPADF